MDSKKPEELHSGQSVKNKFLRIFLVVLLYLILLLNYLDYFFHWSWSWDYFDVILHFLGGAWVALIFFSYIHPKGEYKIFHKFIFALGFVALIGILWEFLEIGVEFIFGNNPFLSSPNLAQDTFSDLLADLVGGLIVSLLLLYLYAFYYKRR